MRSQIIQLRRTLMNTVSHKKYLIFQFYRLPYSTGRFCVCFLAFTKDGMLWRKVKIRHREPQPNMCSSMSGVEALTLGFPPALAADLMYAVYLFHYYLSSMFHFLSSVAKRLGKNSIFAKNEIAVLCIFVGRAHNIFHSIFQTS